MRRIVKIIWRMVPWNVIAKRCFFCHKRANRRVLLVNITGIYVFIGATLDFMSYIFFLIISLSKDDSLYIITHNDLNNQRT